MTKQSALSAHQILSEASTRAGGISDFGNSQFSDFSNDQFAQVEKIYEYFDIEMTAEAAAAMRKFIAENPKGVHGEHIYREEDYGINPDEVRAAFADYIKHFDLRPE